MQVMQERIDDLTAQLVDHEKQVAECDAKIAKLEKNAAPSVPKSSKTRSAAGR